MNAVIQKLKERGYDTVDESFYTHIDDWKSWYQGDVKSFHRYKVRNGKKTVKCKLYTLQMAKMVAEDWANLLMNEKVAITAEGKAEQEFLDDVFTRNNFRVKANEMQELKMALGTVAYLPRVIGANATQDGVLIDADGIELDYVTVEHIYPISWKCGKITECCFESEFTQNDKEYSYLQIHHLVNGKYDIDNLFFEMLDGKFGAEVRAEEIKGYETIPAVIHTESEKRQFVIDKPNIANNVDIDTPLGISVYANAIDALKGVDIAYDSYVNEFALGKKRIMVKPSATTYLDGEPVFDTSDVMFYVLPEDVSDGAVITPIDMTLRTAEHNTGIQDQLNMLSSRCGFGENHYRFDGGSVATATQIVSENSTLFRTLKKHEIILEDVLIELCRIILRLGNSIGKQLNEEVEISIDFDDSIIEDKGADFARDLQLLAAGILNDWEFRMKWLNEDEETAKAALPRMEMMVTEPQTEVE